uniref:Arsenite methyltransferase n=1 Tax=Apteryx owenii TaxID=8824 RepID=A0A8B9P503_APTOW
MGWGTRGGRGVRAKPPARLADAAPSGARVRAGCSSVASTLPVSGLLRPRAAEFGGPENQRLRHAGRASAQGREGGAGAGPRRGGGEVTAGAGAPMPRRSRAPGPAERPSPRYYGCGLVLPERLASCRVLDLGSGSGRDCYLLSQLVGEEGHVTGIDMTQGQVEVARKHIAYHMDKFGFRAPNVDFIQGYMEKLGDAGLADESYDIVMRLPLRLRDFPPLQGAGREPGRARPGYLQGRHCGARAGAGVGRQLHLQGRGGCGCGRRHGCYLAELQVRGGLLDPSQQGGR